MRRDVRAFLVITVAVVIVSGCARPGGVAGPSGASFGAIPSMSRDDLCYVAQTAPDNLKPIAPCLFYENYSTENAALIERSAGGHGWQILARCTKSGGTAAMGAPWAIEIGAPAMDGSESIVGQPTARLSSDEFAGQGVVILHVVIPASGPPMFDQLAATPSDYVGKTC